MKKYAISAFVLLATFLASGEGVPGPRRNLPLDQGWQVKRGEDSKGSDGWQDIKIPGDVAEVFGKGFVDTAWYRVRFDRPRVAEYQLRAIRLAQVTGLADVYFNGKSLGRMWGRVDRTYLRPREFPLDAVKRRGNELLIKVSRGTPDWGPPRVKYAVGGHPRDPLRGLTGAVELILTRKSFIESIDFSVSKPGAECQYSFTANLRKSGWGFRSFKGKLGFEIAKYGGDLPYEGERTVVFVDERPVAVGGKKASAEALTWSALPRFATYQAEFVLRDEAGQVIDVLSKNFHTVYTHVEGRKIFLNNEEFVAKGLVHSIGVPRDDMVLHNRLANMNMVRGLPRHEGLGRAYRDSMVLMAGPFYACVRLCDVWNAERPELTTYKLKVIVEEYRDEPSLIVWNSANEICGATKDYLEALYREFKQHDPYNRPVIHAAAPVRVSPWGQDISGGNYGQDEAALKSFARRAEGKPFIATEMAVGRTLERFEEYFGWQKRYGLSGATEYVYRMPPAVLSQMLKVEKHVYRDIDIDCGVEAGKARLKIRNISPSTLRQLRLVPENEGAESITDVGEIAPGKDVSVGLDMPAWQGEKTFIFSYFTHGGLKHLTYFKLKS